MAEVGASALGASIAQEGFKKLASRVAESLITTAGKKLSALYDSFNVDFEPHLNATFERCANIKTILNRAEPIDLLSIYVNTNFVKGREEFDDIAVIDELRNNKRICITGRGGDGKTVFMKYLWLSLFNDPRGKIPVFIELRRINDLTSDDLLAYIYRSVIDVNSKITQSLFNAAIHAGLFVFILDGFDEVSRDKKDSVERQILSMSHSHPSATIVVSGRPDGRYDSWQMFANYRVLPLKKAQTIELLNKLSYDKSTKRRFIDRVKKDLYEKHQSFLSSPLLSTMMLLTFDQFADIPEKIYIFFDQAFDTLFLRHDATKEGFQRKKHTDLPIDRFKRYFSYFCMITYYDEKIELNETEIRSYAEKAFKANGVSVTSEAFIRDVVESICIMQREGLNYVFTHRSFQEYFAAYCLSTFIESRFRDIAFQLVGRPNDTAISMLLDMQRDKTETKFIIPTLEKVIGAGRASNCHKDIVSFVNHYECIIRSERIENNDRIYVNNAAKEHEFISLMIKLYPDFFFTQAEYAKFQRLDQKAIRSARKRHDLDPTDYITLIFDSGEKFKDPNQKHARIPLEELKSSGYEKYVQQLFTRLDVLLQSLIDRNAVVTSSIDEILGLNRSEGPQE
jgi:uncharacterized protein (DUF924 family)